MQNQDFTTTILVENTPEEVFNAINDPLKWWSEEITGSANKTGDIFDYHYEDVHSCKIKVLELVPGKKVVWHILENDFSFTKDKSEWLDTKVVYDISTEGNKTKLVFTHIGLVPAYECYEACNQGWSNYIEGSLKNYLTTGQGNPNKTGAPQTATEKILSNK